MPPAHSCALLVHSSDRAEVRPYWRPLLLAVDRHFPRDVCDTHFSYDVDDEAAIQVIAGLTQPVTLISRGKTLDWMLAMVHDLRRLQSYRWIFHLMDDAFIPDPISYESISMVLSVAEAHNASLVSLHHASFSYWNGRGSLPLKVEYKKEVISAPGLSAALEFYSPNLGRSNFIYSQNFGLWQRDSLERAFSLVNPNAGPVDWEGAYNPKHQLRRTAVRDDLVRALTVRYARGADGMQGVTDTSHSGRLKAGWGACSYLRTAARLQISPSIVPDGSYFARQPGYSFCGMKGAMGNGRLLLRASPPRCDCRRLNMSDPGSVACACDASYHTT
mmetsp:Transcript_33792/g.88944  ORF Transcript_33792/g.88944 Transcript_33792/m.88944 type:complete len:331 (-) Transcript_33792:147-1139(-)